MTGPQSWYLVLPIQVAGFAGRHSRIAGYNRYCRNCWSIPFNLTILDVDVVTRILSTTDQIVKPPASGPVELLQGRRSMRTQIVWTLVLSMTLMPMQSALAGPATQEADKSVRLQNVELNEKGLITGRLLDSKGQAIVNKEIEVHTRDSVVKQKTDSKGSFAIKAKKGGTCAILVEKNAYACRMWAKGTAPPKALTSFSIVHTGKPIVRGQYDDCGEGCDDGAGGMFGRVGGVSGGQLLGLGLLAGAVVAIVIAANNDDGS